MSCMVPVNSTVASERAMEALLRRREEKMALTPIKLVPSSLDGCFGVFWAYLLTVKRDTEKNCNQISWKLRSLSGES